MTTDPEIIVAVIPMKKTKIRKLHKNIVVAFHRLHQRGALLCRQFSDSDEAKAHGGDYIYFTVKDNTKFPTGVGRFLIEHGLATPGGGWLV